MAIRAILITSTTTGIANSLKVGDGGGDTEEDERKD